jgi:predicted nucleotidyltransferase
MQSRMGPWLPLRSSKPRSGGSEACTSLLEMIALRQERDALLNCQVDLAEAAQLHPLIRDQILAQAKAM